MSVTVGHQQNFERQQSQALIACEARLKKRADRISYITLFYIILQCFDITLHQFINISSLVKLGFYIPSV